MTSIEESEWDVLLDENGRTYYKNKITDTIQYEAPYEMMMKAWKNADASLWRERRELSIERATVFPRPRCFFDINFDQSVGGRVVFELYADKAPLTSFNFLTLCTHEFPNIGKQPLTYQGSLIHNVTPAIGVFGGDITHGLGDGGYSVYGAPFDDENNEELIGTEGLLVSLNDGPNLNLSRFLITLNPCPQYTGIYTVFGHVIKGMSVLRAMCKYVQDSPSGIPNIPICIARCGSLEPGPKPVDFTLPVMPTQRDNPFVMVAPKAITGRYTVIGYQTKMEEKKQAVVDQDKKAAKEEASADSTEKKEGEEGTEPSKRVLEGEEEAPKETTDPNYEQQMMEYYKQYGYYPYYGAGTGAADGTTTDAMKAYQDYQYYQYYQNYQYYNNVATNGYAVQTSFNTKTGQYVPASEAAYYQNPNPSDDYENRVLSSYMNPENLQISQEKFKPNKKSLPAGYKSWKEFNVDRKNAKRQRQIHNIMDEKHQIDEE